MSSTRLSSQGTAAEMPLPPQFESILSVLDMTIERLEQSPLVNVIGLVKDFQPPVKTRRPDWKCSISLVDLSTQFDFDYKPMKINIFSPRDKMLHITGAADVLLVRNAKVQMYSGTISLLSHFSSEFHVFPAKNIPAWPLPSLRALPKSNSAKGQTTVAETSYVVWLHNHIDRGAFPSVEEFESRCKAAMNHKDKYSALEDLKADNFYDLMGEVIKVYENNGRVTMYLSDYTTHSLFYNYDCGGETISDSRDSDDFNYVKSRPKATKDWPGPFGKMSLQLTLYDGHAAFVREHVKVSDWVMLKNVHVKMGSQGGCIEGFLRQDRAASLDKVQVQIISPPEDTDLVDPRWKNAVRRKREYQEQFKERKREILQESENGDLKRKAANESSKPNGKKRRKEAKSAVIQKVAALEVRVAEILDLNMDVKCNNPLIKPSPLSEILHDRGAMLKLSNGIECSAPFVNAKYRANVRVVDFWPPSLKDFSVGRRVSDFDCLSDYSGGENTDPEEDMRLWRAGKGLGGPKKWEWRFALEVECVYNNAETVPERMWLVVGNESAQMLLDKDASNLRQDVEALAAVRETLFRLWGDLEEKKSAFLERKEKAQLGLTATSEQPLPKLVAVRTALGGEMPPDSDEETAPKKDAKHRSRTTALSERNPNVSSIERGVLEEKFSMIEIKNKPFTCCIQQYGVRVPEDSALKANAGDGMCWQRQFGLFGTRIMM